MGEILETRVSISASLSLLQQISLFRAALIFTTGFLMDETEEGRVLEGLLATSSSLLTFFALVALRFIQLLARLVRHDPQHTLVVLYWLFGASIISNIIGFFVSVALALKFGRYHRSKKYSLTISTAASLLFMVLGSVILI